MTLSAKFRRHWLLYAVGIQLAVVLFTTGSALAISISRSYKTTDNSLRTNMIVSLATTGDNGNQLVEAAKPSNKGKVVGIVTTIDASLLTLSNAQAQVYVTTSGDAMAYVSDLNGSIKQGDYIVVSPLEGVGMKAGSGDSQVVGVALEDFNKTTASTQKVSAKKGGDKSVLVNSIKLSVDPHDVGFNTDQKPYLSLFGQSITGKSVSQVQVIVALVIFFMLLVVEGSIIYGAIHSSLIAVGRNPLARKAVFRQLLQVSWLVLLVLLFGLGAIYIILWI